MANVVFMGTPDFAVPCVNALASHSSVELVGVVCQPDKIHGRHKTPQPPPTKVAAATHNIPVFQPRKLKSGPFPEQLSALQPDLIVVTAYGRILPPSILELPPRGCVNVHASLLPRWRGAAPIQWSIADGDAESGVCLMEMEEGLDTGAVYAVGRTPISPEDTGQTLHDRLSTLGAELLANHISDLLDGTLKATPQDESKATYARMLKRQDGEIDWTLPATKVADRVRGFYPWPGAWSTLSEARKTLKLFPPVEVLNHSGTPGTVLSADAKGLVVACGVGALLVTEVQLEGRKRMSVASLLNGFELPAGTVLN